MKRNLYARIEIPETKLDEREKSVELKTIFGTVYAPKSKIFVEEIKTTFEAVKSGKKTGKAIIVVPYWVFTNKGLNPCQMVRGFLGNWN